MDKILLNVNEFCEYTGIGKTKAREMIKDNKYNFVVKIGRRVFVNKEMLDRIIIKVAKSKIVI